MSYPVDTAAVSSLADTSMSTGLRGDISAINMQLLPLHNTWLKAHHTATHAQWALKSNTHRCVGRVLLSAHQTWTSSCARLLYWCLAVSSSWNSWFSSSAWSYPHQLWLCRLPHLPPSWLSPLVSSWPVHATLIIFLWSLHQPNADFALCLKIIYSSYVPASLQFLKGVLETIVKL